MLSIPSSFTQAAMPGLRGMQNPSITDTRFDALLFGSSDRSDSTAWIDDFFDKMQSQRTQAINAISAPSAAPQFPFSPLFAATFGLTGPLPNYITLMTAKLKLNATQNLAFQNIAIDNKDIVKTPESVAKVAMELQQAGIG